MGFFTQLFLAIGLSTVSYIFSSRSRPDQPAQPEQKFEDPVVEAGNPIPVVFGSVQLQQPNILWFGDKRVVKHTVDAGGK